MKRELIRMSRAGNVGLSSGLCIVLDSVGDRASIPDPGPRADMNICVSPALVI